MVKKKFNIKLIFGAGFIALALLVLLMPAILPDIGFGSLATFAGVTKTVQENNYVVQLAVTSVNPSQNLHFYSTRGYPTWQDGERPINNATILSIKNPRTGKEKDLRIYDDSFYAFACNDEACKGYSLRDELFSEQVVDHSEFQLFGVAEFDGQSELLFYRAVCDNGSHASSCLEGKPKKEGLDLVLPIFVDAKACELKSGTMVVAESFSAGTTLTKSDLRFNVKAFCSQTPILVTEGGQVVEQRVADYSFLDEGGFLTIPENQTWTLFYVVDVTPAFSVVCTEESVYNSESNTCDVEPGITFACSDGQFDSELGLCIVQPESRTICEKGFFDVQKNVCVFIIPEDQTQVIIPEGSIIKIDEDSQIRVAEFTPKSTETLCTRGNYNPDSGSCEELGSTELDRFELVSTKVTGSPINSTTAVIVGALALIGIALFFSGGGLKKIKIGDAK